MTDGNRLEHGGVTPDEVAFPQPLDLASGRDPVLARAAQELGVTLSPETAGKPTSGRKSSTGLAASKREQERPVCDRPNSTLA